MNDLIIRQLPKVELHCHLDGSVPLATLYTLAENEGIDPKKMKAAVAPHKCQDLNEYLKSFDCILSVLQTQENLKQASAAVVTEAAKENIRYIELRFAPRLHQEKGLEIKEVLTAVCEGIQTAQENVDIKVNLLICAMRQHNTKDNLQLLREIEELDLPVVVGFDIAGDEAQYPNEQFETVVTSGKNMQLNLTLHSGECGCIQNVVEAVKMGAARIGHGVAIRGDEKTITFCKDHNVLLELCPTSNIQTNAVKDWVDYPLRNFLDKGLPCCINTDNRTVSQTDLSHEFQQLAKYCDLTYQEMKELLENGINYSFADQQTKENLLLGVKTAFTEYI